MDLLVSSKNRKKIKKKQQLKRIENKPSNLIQTTINNTPLQYNTGLQNSSSTSVQTSSRNINKEVHLVQQQQQKEKKDKSIEKSKLKDPIDETLLKSKLKENFHVENQFKGLFTLYSDFVVFDTETTGFSLNDQIIEIGAIRLSKKSDGSLVVVDYFHKFVRIDTVQGGDNFNSIAKGIHGLSEDYLWKNGVCSSDALVAFCDFVYCKSDCKQQEDREMPLLVGHNVAFDIRMLRNDIRKYTVQERSIGAQMLLKDSLKSYCTMALFKALFKNYSSDLDSVSYYLSIDEKIQEYRKKNFHGALIDALLTFQIFEKIHSVLLEK